MAESGCRWSKSGSANRAPNTPLRRTLGPDTALVLKVHASNYRMVGFVEATPVVDVADLGVPVAVDAGSGLLDDTTPWLATRPHWLRDEPGVRQAVDAGASVVTFSGDKLLGGPQAGIVVGRRELINVIARHPLARAIRADKLTLAVLQSVATAYLSGDATAIPLWRMATVSVDALRVRAEAVAGEIPGAKVIKSEAAGGGSAPRVSRSPRSRSRSRSGTRQDRSPASVTTSSPTAADGRVVCDVRTVDPSNDSGSRPRWRCAPSTT